MAKVKMGFRGLSVPMQVERSRLIQTLMAGNANFPIPNPALSVLKSATDALETGYNESRGRDKDKMAIMRIRRKELLDLIRLEAAYVQNASGGDEEKILSSGFDIVRHGVASLPVGQVQNLRLIYTDMSGVLKARWNRLPNARIYFIEVADEQQPGNFIQKGTATKTTFEIKNLTPGKIYYVRVAGIGRLGKGDYSYVISKMAV